MRDRQRNLVNVRLGGGTCALLDKVEEKNVHPGLREESARSVTARQVEA